MKIKENHPKHFSFSAVALNGFNRQICSLDATKAIEHNDIPVKIIPANHDFFFSEFNIYHFNEGFTTLRFSHTLKRQESNQLLRKSLELIKRNTGLSVFCL